MEVALTKVGEVQRTVPTLTVGLVANKVPVMVIVVPPARRLS